MHYSGSGSSLLVACNKLCGKGVFPTLGEIYPSTHKHSFLSDTPRDLNRTLPSYELIAWPLLRLMYYRKDWIFACYSQCLIERYRNCTIITLG